MSTKKRKKHDYAALLKYMHMLDDGYSFYYIHINYGIAEGRLKVVRSQYLEKGVSALQRKKVIDADFAQKKKIVLDIEEHHLTLHSASLKYGASTNRISVWLKMYRQDGLQALAQIKKRGRPPGMGRPRKGSKPLTELERLQKENQELKTEIALLKKSESLSRGKECPSKRDWARAIEGLRQEGHPLEYMLMRVKMARSVFYYHLSRLNNSDGYDDIRNRIRTIYNEKVRFAIHYSILA